MPKPRVVIADDHRLVAAGFEKLLASECDIVGVAYDQESLFREVHRHRPDIVLLGISTPLFAILQKLLELTPTVRIIVVTTNEDPNVAAAALRRGVVAYLLRKCSVAELIEAIHARPGKPYVAPTIAGRVIDTLMQEVADLPQELSSRQREVLRLLAEGRSMKEAAETLKVGVRTVAFHKYRMMRQLNIKTSAELIRFAVAHHIV